MGQIDENSFASLNGSPDQFIFRLLVERTSAAMFVYQNNKIRYANEAFIAMVGYDGHELLEKNFWEIVHPDFRELEKELGSARQQGKDVPSHYEIKLRRKSGEVRWADFTVSILDHQGELAVLITAYDVTELRAAKRKEEEIEEWYRFIVDRSPDPIMVQSDGVLVYLNSSAVKLLGAASLREVVASPITKFVHPQSIAAVTNLLNMIAKIAQGVELNDQRFVRFDGSIIDVDLVTVPTIYLGKSAFQIYLRDVTDQNQSRELLRLQTAALNRAANAIVITDKDAKIVWANPSFETLTGYESSEFMRKKIKDLVKSDKQNSDFYKDLWNTILAGRIWHGELINRRKNGSIYTEDMTIAPVADENGTITHFVAIKQDITERLSLQKQILQSKKLESDAELVGGVAHGYNNILGVILGYGELLRKKLIEDPYSLRSLDAILAATKRGSVLTKQLLAFAQKGIISPEVIDINSAIESTIGMFQAIGLIDENVRLEFAPGRKLWKVKMDPSQLNQILRDLAANAREAIEKIGTIKIRTSNVELDESYARSHVGFAPGNYVLITFSDTGRGMDRETMERVFEPFFSTKVKGQAEGLGLSVVYGIVKRYRGNIIVTSEPDRGTTFDIYLPRHHEENAGIGENLNDDQLRGTETILVVEDEAELLWLVKASLEELGYQVLAAPDPVEALLISKNSSEPIQLLLTDLIMQGMNGKELSEEILKIRPEIKVLFMSGYTANALHPQVYFNKGVRLLQKPFTYDELARRVRFLLNPSPDRPPIIPSISPGEDEKP
ncbi:MAG: PAS domain S-box protein [Candidatus Kryptoniota bacterium]